MRVGPPDKLVSPNAQASPDDTATPSVLVPGPYALGSFANKLAPQCRKIRKVTEQVATRVFQELQEKKDWLLS